MLYVSPWICVERQRVCYVHLINYGNKLKTVCLCAERMDKRLNVHGLFRFFSRFFLLFGFIRFVRLSHLLMKWNFWFPPFTNLITSISTRTLLHTVVGRVECVELQLHLVAAVMCCTVLLWPAGQTRWLYVYMLYAFRHIHTAFCLGTCTGHITFSICLLRYCFECARAIHGHHTHTRTHEMRHEQYRPHIISECIGRSSEHCLFCCWTFMIFKWHIQPLKR